MRAFRLGCLLLSKVIQSDGGEMIPEYATSSMMAARHRFWYEKRLRRKRILSSASFHSQS